jgi:transposase
MFVKQIKQQYEDTLVAGKSQQLELPIGVTYLIPEDEPVRLLWEVLEGINFTAREKGNTTWSTQELFAIWVFGMMTGMYSSRRLEEACCNDIRYMWLLGGRRAPDHSTLSRYRQKVLPKLLDSVFPELMAYLSGIGETDYETVYIDGTKLEANANRYSFVWRKSVEKHFAKLKEKVAGYCDGNVSLDQLEAQARRLREEMTRQGIAAVSGKGRHKHELQRHAEQLEKLAGKWRQYEQNLSILGQGRNSYAKTDKDATFMRMKEDHMRNGQLKPAYNVQLAVNSEYVVGYGVFSDRTDSGTLKPMLQAMEKLHRRRHKSVTADAGYESLENYTYLDESAQQSFIKPINYEQRKKKSDWVGRMEDMTYNPKTDTFTCANGKQLTLAYNGTQKSNTGFESEYSMYRGTECTGCPMRQRCSKAQHKDSKQMKVCWDFVHKRQASLQNITSEKGTLFRVNRSIQIEGTFGVLKQDWGFRRFLTRGTVNVLAQVGLLAFAFNVKKLHAKRQNNRTGSQLFEVDIA